MSLCLLGLGTNLGDRHAQLADAQQWLAGDPRVQVVRGSTVLESAPIGGPAGQGSFLNQTIVVETDYTPTQLLGRTQQCEIDLGRRAGDRWAARPIDVDLLLFNDAVIESVELTLPHPWLCVRHFVLAPAREIASDWIHPRLKRTVQQLFDHLCKAPPSFVLLSSRGPQFWHQIADQVSAELILASDRGPLGTRDLDRWIKCLNSDLRRLAGSAWGQPTTVCLTNRWLSAIDPTRQGITGQDPTGQAVSESTYAQWSDACRRAQRLPPKLIMMDRDAGPLSDPSAAPALLDASQLLAPTLELSGNHAMMVDQVVSAILAMREPDHPEMSR